MRSRTRRAAGRFGFVLFCVMGVETVVLGVLLKESQYSVTSLMGYVLFYGALGVFAELFGLGFWSSPREFPQLLVGAIAVYSLLPPASPLAVGASRIGTGLVRSYARYQKKPDILGTATSEPKIHAFAGIADRHLWKAVFIQLNGALLGVMIASRWGKGDVFGLKGEGILALLVFLVTVFLLSGIDYILSYRAQIARTVQLWLRESRGYGIVFLLACFLARVLGSLGLGLEASYAFLLYVALLSYALWLNLGVSQTYRATIESLTYVIEAKYGYMLGHGAAVAVLSAAMARKLALEEDMVTRIYWSGYIHDIGILALDERVIDKETPLSWNEWLAVSRHTVEGYKLTIMTPFLSLSTAGPLYHHERYDGYGYPMGLKGNAIPLEARIVALADTYHSMIVDRPYRPGHTHEGAVNEIRRLSGTSFDPNLTQVFLDVCDEFERWGRDAFDRVYNIYSRC